MRLLVIAAVLCAPSLAPAGTIDDAFPPTIRIGEPARTRVDRVTLERGDVAWLTVELRQPSSFVGELVVPIDLPAGTRVVGMQLERDDKVVWGRAMAGQVATAHYLHATTPALVSWAGSTGGEDHVTIALRDVTRHSPIIVTLALVLPTVSNLHVEPWQPLVVDGQHATGPTSLAIASPEDSDTIAVDARTSLFADPEVEVFAIQLGTPSPSFVMPSLDKSMIRRVMKAHQAQLRQCYMRVAQWHPEVEGKVDVHFLIDDDGHVITVAADGELDSDEIKTCLVGEVKQWEFPPALGGGRVMVHYPLHFRLDR